MNDFDVVLEGALDALRQRREDFDAEFLEAMENWFLAGVATERHACLRAVLAAPLKTASQDVREACANAIRARGME